MEHWRGWWKDVLIGSHEGERKGKAKGMYRVHQLCSLVLVVVAAVYGKVMIEA